VALSRDGKCFFELGNVTDTVNSITPSASITLWKGTMVVTCSFSDNFAIADILQRCLLVSGASRGCISYSSPGTTSHYDASDLLRVL
jgi:hypothetical protein